MKNTLALLILFIYGGVAFFAGQYTQGKIRVSCPQITVERIQQVPLIPLPTKGKGVDFRKLQGAIPLSALRVSSR